MAQFLALHRDWLTGDLKLYDPHESYKTPPGVEALLLHVEQPKQQQQQSMFAAAPTSSKPEGHGHSKHHTPKTPRESSHTPKTPRDASHTHTPREPKNPRGEKSPRSLGSEDDEEGQEERTERDPKDLAIRKLQAHVRGMLGRVTKAKLIGGVGHMKLDTLEVRKARERRHLRTTRQEIAVMDWSQKLRRAAIAADLVSLKDALKHVKATKDGHVVAPSLRLDGATEVGMTALHYACCSGKEEIVMELLEAGADPRLHTRRAWASHKEDHGGGGGDGEKKEKKATLARGVHQAVVRVEKTAADYARENKMFTMQKMCEQRAFDMTRDDERMAMLRKKQEIEERFGAPRSSAKKTYKLFKLQDTSKLKSESDKKPRSPRKVVHYNARGERVTGKN